VLKKSISAKYLNDLFKPRNVILTLSAFFFGVFDCHNFMFCYIILNLFELGYLTAHLFKDFCL
jgi:hypothetical protein